MDVWILSQISAPADVSVKDLVLMIGGFNWFALAIIAASTASNKGRFGFGYFLASMAFGPIVGITAAALASEDTEGLDEAKIRRGSHCRCASCDEVIRKAATVCPQCGSNTRSPA